MYWYSFVFKTNKHTKQKYFLPGHELFPLRLLAELGGNNVMELLGQWGDRLGTALCRETFRRQAPPSHQGGERRLATSPLRLVHGP